MPIEKKSKKGILERAAEMFDLPGEAVAGMPRIVLTGNRRVLVEYHRGILQYDTEVILINCGSVLLKITGQKLEIVSMSAEELLITGYIGKFEFE